MKKDIYKDISTGKLYYKVKAGTGRFKGMFLWQEIKKILWFYISTKHEFWLDDYGFERIN